MAMFDVSALLNTHLRAKSGEAKMENKVVTTVFSKDVDEVSTGGVSAYITGSEAANKAVVAGALTSDDAEFAKKLLKDLAEAKAAFAIDFYKNS
ncbi:MAG TPA: hypothetical protein PLB21_00520 [Actinomycetota bacterium]|nr:hypothetical protein [Actinomycetota bacterium]